MLNDEQIKHHVLKAFTESKNNISVKLIGICSDGSKTYPVHIHCGSGWYIQYRHRRRVITTENQIIRYFLGYDVVDVVMKSGHESD